MNDIELVIGNKNYSSWSLRPWLLLKNLELPFTETKVSLFTPGFKDKILQHSGAGKVPVLKVNDMTIWESLAISEYLAEIEPRLWPAEANTRSLARSVVAEMHAGFMALRQELPMNCRAKQRRINCSAAAIADIQRIESLWQQCLDQNSESGPWLFGEFGIIDAYFAPVALRFLGYQLDLQPHSQSYIKTQLGNPHLQQWITDGQAEKEFIEDGEVGEK